LSHAITLSKNKAAKKVKRKIEKLKEKWKKKEKTNALVDIINVLN